jgi:hypothetical protein
MTKQVRAKQERVIEAVRRGLEGEAALEFVHQSGYALNGAAMVRYIRQMGGRGVLSTHIEEGKSNLDILHALFPEEDLQPLAPEAPNQIELFEPPGPAKPYLPFMPKHPELFETTKLTLHLPNDLYQALKVAARIEDKKKNDLIVEILTSALSQLPQTPRAPKIDA